VEAGSWIIASFQAYSKTQEDEPERRKRLIGESVMPIEDKPFQRKGAQSNTHVGRAFEVDAQTFFAHKGLNLMPGVTVAIGINGRKPHAFDLGD
jgi:hypothetical protein